MNPKRGRGIQDAGWWVSPSLYHVLLSGHWGPGQLCMHRQLPVHQTRGHCIPLPNQHSEPLRPRRCCQVSAKGCREKEDIRRADRHRQAREPGGAVMQPGPGRHNKMERNEAGLRPKPGVAGPVQRVSRGGQRVTALAFRRAPGGQRLP